MAMRVLALVRAVAILPRNSSAAGISVDRGLNSVAGVRGCWPVLRKKGVCPVDACTELI
jgi:hypothetical protein